MQKFKFQKTLYLQRVLQSTGLRHVYSQIKETNQRQNLEKTG